MQFIDRQHYVVVAARAMRRVLVDSARRRSALKRAAGDRIAVDEAGLMGSGNPEEYLIIDRALSELAAIDPRQAEIVELRFFGGLSVQEIAAALRISEKTVKR